MSASRIAMRSGWRSAVAGRKAARFALIAVSHTPPTRSASSGGLPLEHRVALLELPGRRRGDRPGTRRAVDARVDDLVRLAGLAREGRHQRAALVPQALAALVRRLRLRA